jgi:hypothetical protein
MTERDELAERLARSKEDISIQWRALSVGDDQAQCVAFEVAVARELKIKSEDVASFCVEFLTRCAQRLVRCNDPPTPAEACQYFRALFDRSWPHRKQLRDLVDRLKGTFADLLRQGDDKLSELVLLVCLEHLFVDRKIENFFRDWAEDDFLRPTYEEACHLAALWRKQAEKR